MRGLILAGIVMMLVGMLLVISSSLLYSSQANISVGGFVLIGPVPIVFGNGQYGIVLGILSFVLGILMIALLYAYLRRSKIRQQVS
jgi:uncharacterized membrane protein